MAAALSLLAATGAASDDGKLFPSPSVLIRGFVNGFDEIARRDEELTGLLAEAMARGPEDTFRAGTAIRRLWENAADWREDREAVFVEGVLCIHAYALAEEG